MNIVINCKVSLSKKLRLLIGEKGKVTLIAPDLDGGKGDGKLVIYSDDSNFGDEITIDKTETAIMLIPQEIEEAMPSSDDSGVSSIFSSLPNKGEEEKIVKKIGAVYAPSQAEVPRAVIQQEQAPVPQQFAQTQNPSYQNFVTDIDGLMREVEKARDKTYDIDIESIMDPRKRALALEQRELVEGIDASAYVVNVKAGKLEISDLEITLVLNMPFDLSKISAKRIAGSRQLIDMLQRGWVKFLDPSETGEWVRKAEENIRSMDRSIEVFDHHEVAESNAYQHGFDVEHSGRVTATQAGAMVATTSGGYASRGADRSMEIRESDLEFPTEEQSMILDLTSDSSRRASADGVRRSSHGNSGHSGHSRQATRPSAAPMSLSGAMDRSIAGPQGTEHKSIRRMDEY